MKFRIAKLDKIATTVSIGVSALLVGLSIFFIIKIPFGWAFAVLMMLIIIICYLLSPKRYFSKGSTLVIEKVIGKKIIIPFDKIEGYARVPNFAKLNPLRTFGNGGLFGYYGKFYTATYGSTNCQLTSFKNVFIIKSKKGSFALSPAEPDKFEEHLKTVITGIQAIEPAVILKKERASMNILLIPIILFVVAVVLVLLNYMQLPERIPVHFDFQGNPDAWRPKTSYLLNQLPIPFITLIITIIVFLIVNRATIKRVLPNFLVLVGSFIQLCIAYMLFDVYWVNKHDAHFIPLLYSVVVFSFIVIVLIFFYYRKVAKESADFYAR